MELYHRAPTGLPGRQAGETNIQDDPKARELLRRANERTYRWPKGFGGFSADLVCTQAGKVSKGRVEIKSAREILVILDNEVLQKWAEGQIGMMAIHRSARPFEEADGRFSLTLGEDDHHPLGQLILIHGDGMGSRYRVKEDRITQINRNMERIRFTINVDDILTTTDARFLTTRYTVYYFIPADGRLINVESFSDNHEVVEGIHLPGIRRVSFAEDGQVVSRTLSFRNHTLL